LDLGIDLERIPEHVAIIMDGNGRWASGKGWDRLKGHHHGYRRLRDILLDSERLGIKCLTVYGFSAENWRRPPSEVGGLMSLIDAAARAEINLLIEENVQVQVIGRREGLPDWLQESLRLMVESTRNCSGMRFVLAINYGGRAEIVDAVRRLAAEGVPPDEIDDEAIRSRLYSPDLPDPDLIIRTAGEMRLSNFLIWQAAYAELVVTEAAWPEFGRSELISCVAQFQKRVRKFGGLAQSS
jgi:undecaprenyl diphosphate synthase